MPRPYRSEICWLWFSSEELLLWYIGHPLPLHLRTDEIAKLTILLVLLSHGETETVYVCEKINTRKIDLYNVDWFFFLVYATPFYF